MPMGQVTEPMVLDQFFGCAIAQMNQTITAPAATTTSLTVMGSAGSGGIDVAIPANSYIILGTPGTGATQNNYTHVDVLQVTALANAGATTLTIASQTVGKITGARGLHLLPGLDHQPEPGAVPQHPLPGTVPRRDSAGRLQPTSRATGERRIGYARIAVLNNNANFPDATGTAAGSVQPEHRVLVHHQHGGVVVGSDPQHRLRGRFADRGSGQHHLVRPAQPNCDGDRKRHHRDLRGGLDHAPTALSPWRAAIRSTTLPEHEHLEHPDRHGRGLRPASADRSAGQPVPGDHRLDDRGRVPADDGSLPAGRGIRHQRRLQCCQPLHQHRHRARPSALRTGVRDPQRQAQLQQQRGGQRRHQVSPGRLLRALRGERPGHHGAERHLH